MLLWIGIAVLSLAALALTWCRYKPQIYLDDSVVMSALNKRLPKYNLPKNCLVTGGSGFLGRHIVDALLEAGCNVTIFDIVKRYDYPDVKVVVGSLVDKADVKAALKGQDVVFHVASPPPHLDNAKVFHDVNVKGTQNVVDCCVEEGVGRLVFTSSASVVYSGADQQNFTEDSPYPSTARDVYCETKILAEAIVLKAAKAGLLAAASVRPHGIFGPRDPQLVPTLVDTCKKGKTKFAIGTGSTMADFTYVGNVVHAHLLAAEKLVPGSPVSGNAYFITNDEPVSFWGFLSSVLLALGYPTPYMRLPYVPILLLSQVLAVVVTLLKPFKTIKPTFTPSRIQLAGTHHWYSCEKAKRDLKYKPVWSVAEGLAIVQRRFKHLRNSAAPGLPLDDPVNYTASEVSRHCTNDDAWLVIDGGVYDVTDYIDYHPGGDKLLRNVGGDASAGFHGPQHPSHVFETFKQYRIGTVVDKL